MKKWNITKFIAIGAIAVIRLLTVILIYNTLFLASGSIYAGLIVMIIGPFFNILAALVINKFGSSTVFSGIRSILELPTPTIWPKLFATLFNIINGVVVDISWKISKKKSLGFCILSGAAYNFFVIIESIFLLLFIGLPMAETTPDALRTPVSLMLLTLIFAILGGFVGYLTHLVFERIKNTAVVKRIQK